MDTTGRLVLHHPLQQDRESGEGMGGEDVVVVCCFGRYTFCQGVCMPTCTYMGIYFSFCVRVYLCQPAPCYCNLVRMMDTVITPVLPGYGEGLCLHMQVSVSNREDDPLPMTPSQFSFCIWMASHAIITIPKTQTA